MIHSCIVYCTNELYTCTVYTRIIFFCVNIPIAGIHWNLSFGVFTMVKFLYLTSLFVFIKPNSNLVSKSITLVAKMKIFIVIALMIACIMTIIS